MALVSDETAGPVKTAGYHHPYNFTLFQNYCCGPKSKLNTMPSNKDLAPIPENFKEKAENLLIKINDVLRSNITKFTSFSSSIPSEFFDSNHSSEYFRYLVDRTTLKIMNDAGVTNWLPSLNRLYPVRTSGNGNCLLHAILISMVAVHDFDLIMRDLLINFMESKKDALKRYWKTDRIQADKIYGIQSEESTLETEWKEVCDIVRYERKDDGQLENSLRYLEAIHVFCVSNMLARPIIIFSEDVVRNKHGEAISFNDLFGIYLPVLVDKTKRIRQPIVLVYDQSHFCPLVPANNTDGSIRETFLPLYQSSDYARDQRLLPVKFPPKPLNPQETIELLKDYLNLQNFSYCPGNGSSEKTIICASLSRKEIPQESNFFRLYYHYLVNFHEVQMKMIDDPDDTYYRRPIDYMDYDRQSQENLDRVTVRSDSSAPPPSYSSVMNRQDSEKRTNIPIERRPSYESAVNNGVNINVLNQKQKPASDSPTSTSLTRIPVQHTSPAQAGSQLNYGTNSNVVHNENKISNIKKINRESVPNDLLLGEKLLTKTEPSPRLADSKLKQGQPIRQDVPPPIHENFRSPSNNNQNLIDFDRKTDRFRNCIVCKRNFEDLKSIRLCSKCDNKNQQAQAPNFPRLQAPTNRTTIAMRQENRMQSDFLSPISMVSLTTRQNRRPIECRHCKTLNPCQSQLATGEMRCLKCYSHITYRP